MVEKESGMELVAVGLIVAVFVIIAKMLRKTLTLLGIVMVVGTFYVLLNSNVFVVVRVPQLCIYAGVLALGLWLIFLPFPSRRNKQKNT